VQWLTRQSIVARALATGVFSKPFSSSSGPAITQRAAHTPVTLTVSNGKLKPQARMDGGKECRGSLKGIEVWIGTPSPRSFASCLDQQDLVRIKALSVPGVS